LLGLAALEECNMIHRDIKGSNIFITKDNKVKIGIIFYFILFYFLYLGDFGCSRILSFDSHNATTCEIGTWYDIVIIHHYYYLGHIWHLK
jgi:serine/threonine protein kinase